MMSLEDQLDELLSEMNSLYQRAKKGERGRIIARDIRDVRSRLEDAEVAAEESPTPGA